LDTNKSTKAHTEKRIAKGNEVKIQLMNPKMLS
jgi:hypothetical protein